MTLVLFELEAKEGRVDDLKAMLREALPDTRATQDATTFPYSLIQMGKPCCSSKPGTPRRLMKGIWPGERILVLALHR